MARWQSGYAAACKAVNTGSIPVLASLIKVPTTLRLKLYPTKIGIVFITIILDTKSTL